MNKQFSALWPSLQKFFLYLIMACFLLANAACGSPSAHADNLSAQGKHNGLMLDNARRYYSVAVIKQYIDTLAENGGGFLHLHFSDHENYGLESKLLNQKAADADVSDGLYRNPQTGKPFLSDAQLGEIVAYAHEKKIELIPELGSPNHMGGIFTLLTHYRGKDYVQSIKSNVVDDEIDITNSQSIALVESLMTEVMAKFPHSKRFHIGADEFGYSVESHPEFVAYVNRLADFLARKGWKTQMWNDGLIKQSLADLNRQIEVAYWSYDGNAQDKAERKKRRHLRASMPELIEAGFKVWNYNSYYLYFIPGSDVGSSHDTNYAIRDVEQNWHLGVWDDANSKNALPQSQQAAVGGAALAVWGEHSDSLSDQTMFAYTHKLLEAVLAKANRRNHD
ncbi:family 20 glycosylhydrolase [Neisseria yangbaofengii]|uniref:family 20 glycosylhydrolase n=1 Tax=Neisseria yangbaofengii TaxID=2709396 RepID=UPI00197D4CDF|nr:family 20 glycosylhydrolase [Neisseria yangbaofengii]